MLKHLSIGSLAKLLPLYNRIWDEGRLPECWKEAIIIPIKKPGKDTSRTENYRPIALTSHICKVMEHMINERLIYLLESRGMLAAYQSGFRKGTSIQCWNEDPVLCLEDEVRKVQVNKESVAAVFFDAFQAIQVYSFSSYTKWELGGEMFSWVMNFSDGRTIQVKKGSEVLGQYVEENGMLEGSVLSPTLLSIMINYIFAMIPMDMGKSLFADDGALWKRVLKMLNTIKKLQNGINQVEEWGTKWGFKSSVEKTKDMRRRNCRTYSHVMQEIHTGKNEMMFKFRRRGQVNISIKNILEWGDSDKGRRVLFHFLRATGLDRRI